MHNIQGLFQNSREAPNMFKKGILPQANTSQPDFPKLMKVLVTTVLNRLSSLYIPSWHITLFTVSYFLLEILRIPDNGRNRNLENLEI